MKQNFYSKMELANLSDAESFFEVWSALLFSAMLMLAKFAYELFSLVDKTKWIVIAVFDLLIVLCFEWG